MLPVGELTLFIPAICTRDQWLWLALDSREPALNCPWDAVLLGFPSCGKEQSFTARCLWLKVGFCLLKLGTSKDFSQVKAECTNSSGWPWFLEGHF